MWLTSVSETKTWSKFRCSPELSRVLKPSSWFSRVGPLPDPEPSGQPDPGARLHEAEKLLLETGAGASSRDSKRGAATRSPAGGASPVELLLVLAPEPPPGQHHEQRRDALQMEGAVSTSGTSEEKDGLHENAGGGRPAPWAQGSEPHQTRSVDLLPTFTSRRPADLPALTPAPAASSRTSEPRYVSGPGPPSAPS